jgi:hypothetical protein
MAYSGLAQTNFAIFWPTIKHDRKPKERNMTKFNSTHKFTAAAAFGAAAIFSMLSFGSNAEAASVSSCQATTAKKVVDCCEQMTKKKGRPFWMIQSGTNCHQAAVCRGKRGLTIGIAAVAVKPCYIQAVYKINDGGGDKDKGDDKPSRGPNSIR